MEANVAPFLGVGAMIVSLSGSRVRGGGYANGEQLWLLPSLLVTSVVRVLQIAVLKAYFDFCITWGTVAVM